VGRGPGREPQVVPTPPGRVPHVDFGPSAVKEKTSKILLISYDKNWAPPLITYSTRNMAIDVGAFSSSCTRHISPGTWGSTFTDFQLHLLHPFIGM
jgi:hypothetical protein